MIALSIFAEFAGSAGVASSFIQIASVSSVVFVSLFSLDAVLSMVGFGLVLGPDAYLQNVLHWIDILLLFLVWGDIGLLGASTDFFGSAFRIAVLNSRSYVVFIILAGSFSRFRDVQVSSIPSFLMLEDSD